MPLAAALAARALESYLDVHAPNMVFLCSVILAAIWFGRRVALATALFAFFVYNFYLVEPRNTFGFAGFEDVLTLLVFVGTALLIGGLAGTLHDERDRAEEQVRIFSGLFATSRAMAESDSSNDAMNLLAAGACRIAAAQAFIFQRKADGIVLTHSHPTDVHCPGEVRHAAEELVSGPGSGVAKPGWEFGLFSAADESPALLAWKLAPQGRSAEHAMAVRLLLEMTNAAIERDRYFRRRVEVDALASTERLRTALLSSLSHDFRTPLSTILTSASSLLTYDDKFSTATRVDLLTGIQEEAERLNRFVRNILDMTRLDAGVVQPKQVWTDPLEVIENISERMRKRAPNRVLSIEAPAAVPAIQVDTLLLEQAMVNIVENAIVHTPSECRIRIGADYSEDEVRLWVEDDGPGVPAAELAAIFDKFRRLGNSQKGQGAGLGLAISKGFVEAMGGEIRAISPCQRGGGLRVESTFKLLEALEEA
jgi:two-component system sensor histidine kinase KdpD